MNAEAMAIRMSVLGRALPPRILVVEDDALELEAIADRLIGAGFDIQTATNGAEALEHLARQWFPVMITDWQMPVMDGIELTRRLRAQGVADTYIIMLTMREASPDYEQGYLSGVDDYLTKKLANADLMIRIHAAFATLSLRRTLHETRAALEAALPIDPQSGAFTAAESLMKLNSELRRAQRYGRLLSVMTVAVQSASGAGLPSDETLQAAVAALRRVIRTHIDWIGRIETGPQAAALLVVLPEAAQSDGPAIKARMNQGLAEFGAEARGAARVTLEFGFASLDRSRGDGTIIDVHDLVGVAEQCRKCPGQAGAQQLSTVQRSVAAHVGICCRHGYAVDDACALKSGEALVYPSTVRGGGDRRIAR